MESAILGIRSLAFASVFSGLMGSLLACNGGEADDHPPGASTAPPAADDPPAGGFTEPPVIAGQFKDANVAGLSFESGAQMGVTDGNGSFSCESNRSVTFSVGAVTLGSSPCTDVVAPLSLVPGSTLDTPQAINVVRFLLMLDANGDPDDGIQINDRVQLIAESWSQVDFAAPDLEVELQPIISDLTNGDLPVLPDAATARAHLLATLECVYAGVYWIDTTSETGDQLDWGMLTILPTEVEGMKLAGTVYGTDPERSFVFSVSASGLMFGAVTRLNFADSSGYRSVDAQFTSSSRISGLLNTGEVVEGYRHEQTTTPRHRFVAKLEYEPESTSDFGMIIELVDDRSVAATEYGLGWWDGRWNISYEGTIEDGIVTLTSTTEPENVLTGTVDLEASPPVMALALANGATGNLTAYGCRLN